MIQPMVDTDDPRLVRYLLGELRDEEQTRFEEEYFVSPETLERLAAAEDELIDDYVDGRLQGDTRARFEEWMSASPSRRERVGFARQLARYAASNAGRARESTFRRLAESPIAHLAMAAALVLSLGIAAWMAVEINDLRRELRRVESARQELAAREQTLTAALEEQRKAGQSQTPPPKSSETPAKPTAMFSVSLVPGLVRSPGGAARVRLPAGTGTLRLELQLPQDSAQSYSAVVETARGREIWKQDGLTPSGRVLATDVPARLFSPGDYVVMLTARTADGPRNAAGYSFSIVRP